MKRFQQQKHVQSFPPDLRWIRSRQNLLRQLKLQVRQHLGHEPREIQVYTRAAEKEFRQSNWKISNKEELLSRVQKADLILGGDFHSLPRTQRTHLKILEAGGRNPKRPLILGLEAFQHRFQKFIDKYLNDELDEEELWRKTEWKKTWGFSQEGYQMLLEFAKRGGHKVVALGEDPQSSGGGEGKKRQNLKSREVFAARLIQQVWQDATHFKKVKPQIYILFGDLHLADRYLPRLLEKNLKKSLKMLVIHTHSETLYFELAKKGLESSVEVLQLNKKKFCLLSSPPWVHWQSYLLHLEREQDAHLSDIDDDADQLLALIQLLARDFGLDIRVDDIAVFSEPREALLNSLRRSLNAEEMRVAQHMMANGQSFYLPQNGIFFLSSSTLNRAAELAGYYLHARLSGQQRPLWRTSDSFEAMLWSHAVSFFISKLINHRRRAETNGDLLEQRKHLSGSRREMQTIEFVLAYIENSKVLTPHLFSLLLKNTKLRLESSRILGSRLGERLYLVYRARQISTKKILKWMRFNPLGPEFHQFYQSVLKDIDHTRRKWPSRKERF